MCLTQQQHLWKYIHHLTPTCLTGGRYSWMVTPDMVKLWAFDPSPTIFCRKILPQPPFCIGCVSILDIKTTSKSHQSIIFQPFSNHFPHPKIPHPRPNRGAFTEGSNSSRQFTKASRAPESTTASRFGKNHGIFTHDMAMNIGKQMGTLWWSP